MAASKPSRTTVETSRKASKAPRKASKRSCSPAKPAKKAAAKKARKAPAKRTTKTPAKKRPAKKTPPKPTVNVPGTNAAAAVETIEALGKANRIGPAHTAVVTLVGRLARACDFAPDNASLWREYRQALAMLLGDDETDTTGDTDGPTEMDRLRQLLAE